MFCKTCGKEVNQNAEFCLNCGVNPQTGNAYCYNCGVNTNPEQVHVMPTVMMQKRSVKVVEVKLMKKPKYAHLVVLIR